MSDGKYLINKSSLTGIADAVRDKLGVGEATTDPQTGDIVYPEGKGYYIGDGEVEVIAVPNGSGNAYGRGTSSSPGYTEKQIIDISSSVYSQKIEKPFYQLEIEGCFYSTLNSSMLGDLDFSLQTSYSDSSRIELQNDNTILQKVTKNFDSAQNRLYIKLVMLENDYGGEAYYYTRFKVLLKDENGVPIKLISSGFPFTKNGVTCSIDTVNQKVQKPIPYSVADIKNNIEDYWSIPDGSLNISANGTYDVTDKAEAVVNVPNPSTGSLNINANGTYDVTDKASAIVSVSPSLQTKTTTISQNGSQTITPDSNYDGLSSVNLTISVPNPSTGSLEITENGTYDVTDKAEAVVNVSSGGGGGGTAPIPTYVGFDYQRSSSSYVNLHDYISQVQNEQDVMAALLCMYCSDASVLAIKPTGGFYSYKQLGWANPSPTISGLTTEQIADAYENNRIIPLIKNSGGLSATGYSPNKNQLYVVIVGTKIYICYQKDSYPMNWCRILSALY